MRRSIVFFDLDGTLCDSMPNLVDLFIRLNVEYFGVAEDVAGKRVPELLKLAPRSVMMAGFEEMAGAAFTPENNSRYREALNAGQADLPVVLFPEVAEVLRRLAEQGYRLVLTTNSQLGSLDARLDSAGIRDHFSLVFGTDSSSGMSKGPDHIQRAERALGLTAEALARQSVLIGDAEGDMSIAKDAGMVAIGRVTGENGPSLRAAGADYLINDLFELEPVLAQFVQ